MKNIKLQFKSDFRVLIGNKRGQAAEMVIAPGDAEGGPDNRHRGSDQWLYIQSGTGLAVINGQRCSLSAGKIILIERGDRHEIRNTGRAPLKTLNIYVPPAYTKSGNELPRGKK